MTDEEEPTLRQASSLDYLPPLSLRPVRWTCFRCPQISLLGNSVSRLGWLGGCAGQVMYGLSFYLHGPLYPFLPGMLSLCRLFPAGGPTGPPLLGLSLGRLVQEGSGWNRSVSCSLGQSNNTVNILGRLTPFSVSPLTQEERRDHHFIMTREMIVESQMKETRGIKLHTIGCLLHKVQCKGIKWDSHYGILSIKKQVN